MCQVVATLGIFATMVFWVGASAGGLMTAIQRGRYEAMAADLAALASAEALHAFDRIAERPGFDFSADPRMAVAVERLLAAGLLRTLRGGVPCLSPRGRDVWMSLRNWTR